MTRRSIQVGLAVCLLLGIPLSSSAQDVACDLSGLPTCGGVCPMGEACKPTGDDVVQCFCGPAPADACLCDLTGPAGDLGRAITAAHLGEVGALVAADSNPANSQKALKKMAFHPTRTLPRAISPRKGAQFASFPKKGFSLRFRDFRAGVRRIIRNGKVYNKLEIFHVDSLRD